MMRPNAADSHNLVARCTMLTPTNPVNKLPVMIRSISLVVVALLCALWGGAARAQMSQADLLTRIDRLEAALRELTGTVEQLQYRNQQLEQQLRALQDASQTGARPPMSAQPQSPPRPTGQFSPPPAAVAPAPVIAAAPPPAPIESEPPPPPGRGAPGAAGLIAGLKASPRPLRPGGGGGGSGSIGGGAAAMTGAGAAGGGEYCPVGRGGDCSCGDAGGRAPVWLASCSARSCCSSC